MKINKKKINNIIQLILFIFIVLFINTNVFATTGIISETTVKLRSKPATDSSILTLISVDEKVEIISEDGEWYKVKYNDLTGYIRNDLIKVDGENASNTNTTQANNNTTTNTDSTANSDIQINVGDKKKTNKQIGIKRVPTMTSKEFTNIDTSTDIEISSIMNSWVKIKTSDKEGWIRVLKLKDALKEGDSISQEEVITKEATETSLEQSTKVGFVNADTLNLREKADKASKIIKNLSKNQEVEILENSEGWYKIKIDNVTGYVAEKYISDTKVEVTTRSSDEDRKSTNNEVENNKSEEVKEEEALSTSKTKGSDVVQLAEKYIKTKYVLGGSSPETGFDCSGFTSYIYGKFGISLARTTSGQKNQGTEVQKGDLQVGDLLIFNNSSNTSVGHVGIYIGNNQFIHASNPSPYPAGGVKITSLSDSYYKERYVCGKRLF